MDQEEGMGWTADQVESAEVEYKRYLNLCMVYGKGMVPNKIMDQTWHYHILDTIAYHEHCEKLFGGYMHHYPYFGMRGEQGRLAEIVALKEKYNFRLLVDDAHGFGTMGETGAGTGEHCGVQDQIDIYFSTFAKSMASLQNQGMRPT